VRFLALDKCLPGRKFLQLLDIKPSSQSTLTLPSSPKPQFHLEYDPEWLAITRVFASSLILGDRTAKTPIDLGEEHYRPLIEAEEAWVDEHIVKTGKLTIPENFTITAPVHYPDMPEIVREGPQEYNNPQTAAFCDLVGIENGFFATEEERAERMSQGPAPVAPRRDGEFSGGRGRGRDGGYWRGGERSGRGGRGRRRFRGRG
jgi:lariat debranching enzyme